MAAVKISSGRRKAAQKFWAPQQGHPFFAEGVVLSFFGERKYPKNAAKTKVLESFAHIGLKSSANFTLRNRMLQTKPLLSYGLCAAIRLLLPQPTLNGWNRDGFCVYRFGAMWASPPTEFYR